MSQIKEMRFVYHTLEPVDNSDNYYAFVGTVTFCIPEELPLDFCVIEDSQYPKEDGTVKLCVTVREFVSDFFEKEYQNLGISSEQLTAEFFRQCKDKTFLTEVYTEYVRCSEDEKTFIPLTLESAVNCFQDGTEIDYSDRISVSVLTALADVA